MYLISQLLTFGGINLGRNTATEGEWEQREIRQGKHIPNLQVTQIY